MAIVNNGTRVSMTDVPSGFTRASITEFSDWEYSKEMTISVAKATVENATRSTTLTNIIDNATVGTEKQIEDLITADFIGSNTVTFFMVLKKVSTNILPSSTGDFYTNTAVSYVCTVDVYIKTA